jgi:putative hydrolase
LDILTDFAGAFCSVALAEGTIDKTPRRFRGFEIRATMRAPDENPQQLPLSNAELAEQLDEMAELLEAQHANPFRVRAYRTAANTMRSLDQPVHELLMRDGLAGLTRLSGIGESLGRSIERLTLTGRLELLERLRGETATERIFATVPSIGPKMGVRIHEQLGIETLAELEAAAYDGRLAQVSGMGNKRIRAVRESLAGRFRLRPRVPESVPAHLRRGSPPVAELLSVDEEYRRKAQADRLFRIAPRRFNPTGEAWLPILHTHRGDRHYTALYSNTARAHELGTVRDWVVIYRDDGAGDGQWTVVTARFGDLKDRRIVRGREAECQEYYQREESPTGAVNRGGGTESS